MDTFDFIPDDFEPIGYDHDPSAAYDTTNGAFDADTTDTETTFRTLGGCEVRYMPNGTVVVTDIFGHENVFMDKDDYVQNCDVMSGQRHVTTSHSHSSQSESEPDPELELRRERREEREKLTRERDEAVDEYHRAIDNGDYEAALAWERQANDKQSWLETKYNIPNYTPGSQAPGLNK